MSDDIFDFGFTLVTEDELDAVQEASTKVVEAGKTEEKLQRLYDAIQPLLNNLQANPEKDIIKWPGADRVKKIGAFKTHLESIMKE